MPQSSTANRIARGLHSARLSTYLAASGGDQAEALNLYRWNLRLAAALHTSLSLTEVLFRNAIDGQLRAWNSVQSRREGGQHSADWLLDPARPLNSLIEGAQRRATQNATAARAARPRSHPRKLAAICHDDVLAQLTFGVFVRLLPTDDLHDPRYRGRRVLWTEALTYAFPTSRNDPDGIVIESRATRLHALRNRVAHLEPLLDVNAQGRHRDMVRLIGCIDPALQGWFSGTSRTVEVARERPPA
jgi:hypothetical protein